MAYSKAQLSAGDAALLAADKPILCGPNAGAVTGVTAWWNNVKSFAAGSDQSATSQPARYAVDEYNHVLTYPNAAGTTWYLLFDFGAAGIEFDTILLVKHNVNGVTYSVEVADNNAFTTNLEALVNGAVIGTSKRYPSLTLFGGNGYRYSTVRYVAITFASGGAITPQVGEVWFLRRRQLKFRPSLPYDDRFGQTRRDESETYGGIIQTVARGQPQRRMLDAQWSTYETAYIDDLHAWIYAVEGGNRPFVWFERPTTDPNEAYVFKSSDDLWQLPLLGPLERRASLRAKEQGPYFYRRET